MMVAASYRNSSFLELSELRSKLTEPLTSNLHNCQGMTFTHKRPRTVQSGTAAYLPALEQAPDSALSTS